MRTPRKDGAAGNAGDGERASYSRTTASARQVAQQKVPTMAEDDMADLIACAYNEDHVMKRLKWTKHMRACPDGKQHGHKFGKCKFNGLHVVPKSELADHERWCLENSNARVRRVNAAAAPAEAGPTPHSQHAGATHLHHYARIPNAQVGGWNRQRTGLSDPHTAINQRENNGPPQPGPPPRPPSPDWGSSGAWAQPRGEHEPQRGRARRSWADGCWSSGSPVASSQQAGSAARQEGGERGGSWGRACGWARHDGAAAQPRQDVWSGSPVKEEQPDDDDDDNEAWDSIADWLRPRRENDVNDDGWGTPGMEGARPRQQEPHGPNQNRASGPQSQAQQEERRGGVWQAKRGGGVWHRNQALAGQQAGSGGSGASQQPDLGGDAQQPDHGGPAAPANNDPRLRAYSHLLGAPRRQPVWGRKAAGEAPAGASGLL